MDLLFEHALLADEIASQVALSISAEGRITHVQPQSPRNGRTYVPGLALFGMANLHSHAFQRGIAGCAEVAASGSNSFWGWRDVMYRFVSRLEPAEMAAIAAFAYLEMLEAGYTAVAEFHYVHQRSDGSPYADPGTMASALRAAAELSGIRQLLLPCLYQRAGFSAPQPAPEQCRFGLQTGQFLQLYEALRGQDTALHTTGVAVHSLRAVSLDSLREVLSAIDERTAVHMHIAEQRREVDDCLQATGQRPIEFLLDKVALDSRWCLVHATHSSRTELQALARSAAVVGLCPTTEANLGDGRFALDDFTAHGGRFGIGSDSHVSIDPREELRSAEYNLRLWREHRGLVSSATQPHCGTYLYTHAAAGGAQALGLAHGTLAPAAAADIVVLDTARAQFSGVSKQALLDAYIFAPRAGAVRDVMVGGRWVLRDGRHPRREAIIEAYRASIARLIAPGAPHDEAKMD